MLACPTCSKSFLNLFIYNKHQILYRHLCNVKFICKYSHCNSVCSTYTSFAKHVTRYHSKASNGNFNCKFKNCNFTSTNSKLFKLHCRHHIQKSNKSNLECNFCTEKTTFFTKNAYKIHVSRYHKNIYEEEIVINSKVKNVHQNIISNDSQIEIDQIPIDNEIPKENARQEVLNVLRNNTKEIIKKTITPFQILSEFYLRLRTKHLATDNLIQDAVNTFDEVIHSSQLAFKSSLGRININDDTKKSILFEYDESMREIIDSHEKKNGLFRSNYRMKQYFENNHKFIEPVEVSIKDKGKDTGFSYSYVPLLKTLQVMVLDDDLRKHCNNPQETREKNGFFDLHDGLVIKKNDCFNNNPNSLKIVLFQDAFEVCNTINSI